MTLKLTLNDFEDHRSLSQNDLDDELVKCTKFEASIFKGIIARRFRHIYPIL